MANTYAFAICGALLMAVTLAPVLCSFFFVNKKEAPDTMLDKIMKLRYLRALSWVLRHRLLTLAVMGALFAYTLFLIPHLGGEFMPPLEEGYLWIRAIAAADGLARERGQDGAPAARGDRLGSRGQPGHLAARPARRRHRRHRLLQPGDGRPLEADGRVAEEAVLSSSATSSGTRRSAARTSRRS